MELNLLMIFDNNKNKVVNILFTYETYNIFLKLILQSDA